jgi:hypothetical protein
MNDCNITEISTFLRNIADKLEQNSLTELELKLISEFFMEYSFINREQKEIEDDISDKDFRKFLSLGWYIYNKIDEKL